MKKNHHYIFPLLLSIGAIISFVLRFWAFQQTTFANGWDSYFYLIQLKSLVEEGAMHSSDMSLVYPLMLGVKLLIKDYELTFKCSAALLAAFFTLNVGVLTRKMTGSWQLALFAVAFTLMSPHLTYFAAQYPKNLLGLSLFLLLVGQIPTLFGNPSSKKQWMIGSALLLFNVFGHRMTIVLGLLFLMMVLVFQKFPIRWLLISIASFLGLLLLGILLPGLLSFADLSRFDGFLATLPQWAPLSFWDTFGEDRISTIWLIEIGTTALLLPTVAILSIRSILKNTQQPLLIWLLLCLLLVFPFFKWSLDGIGYRLYLAYVLLIPFSLWMLMGQQKGLNQNWYLGLSVLVCSISPLGISGYQPGKHDPPYKRYQQLTERSIQKLKKSQLELMIAHKSLAEYFTFYSGIDALPWLPEYPIDKEKLWRIATDLNPNEYKSYLPEASLDRLSSNYYLVREDQWQSFLGKLKEAEGEEGLSPLLTWKNPNRVRPFYLLKNKQK